MAARAQTPQFRPETRAAVRDGGSVAQEAFSVSAGRPFWRRTDSLLRAET
jgi:hypothetical protein